MALLGDSGSNYFGMKQVFSKLEKLRMVLESQSIQLLNVLEQEKDQCEFLERTLEMVSDQTLIWKTVSRQDTVREIRRRSEANPRFDFKNNYSPRLLSPGLRSENSRRPSTEMKMEGQNIYTNMQTPRINPKPSVSILVQKPEFEFSEIVIPGKQRGIFSRRATVIESVAVTQRWNKGNHSVNNSPERDSASPKTVGTNLSRGDYMTKMAAPPNTSGDELKKQSSNKMIPTTKMMNHGPSSQKSMKPALMNMLGESRKQSFVPAPKPPEEGDQQGRRNILKEASLMAEDLNTTLRKLKIKSRGLLDKLSESRMQASKGLEVINSFKKPTGGTKQTEVSSGELRVLSLAVPPPKERSPTSMSTFGKHGVPRPV